MRTRMLAVTALVTLSSVLSSQVGGRRPPTGDPGRTAPKPGAAPLPKEAPDVARALAFKRSRWSGEAYTLMSAIRTPVGSGGVVTSTGFGTGTHADYRHSPFFSSSVDMTYSPIGWSGTSSTIEVGSRYSPLPLDEKARPFFDVRGGYMFLWDQVPTGNPGAIQSGLAQQSRYSRGFGALVGTGLDYRLTNSFSVITELAATRNRMVLNQNDGPAQIGTATRFWMTTYRYTIGLKYNATNALHLAQNPRQ